MAARPEARVVGCAEGWPVHPQGDLGSGRVKNLGVSG